jgi:hypothetical protein
LDKVLEPKPTQEFKEADPKHYRELLQQPSFLCLRATKLANNPVLAEQMEIAERVCWKIKRRCGN